MIWIQQIPVRQSPPPCPSCALTIHELSAGGRVGCANCYKHYSEILASYIKKISNGAAHIGGAPASAGPGVMIKRRLQNLENELKFSIAEQRFERCAELRDEIAALKGADM